jgi:divalent metal cation (Fe/Co/Zn/Cd) transporter
MGGSMVVDLSSRDLVAITIIVAVVALLFLGMISVDQALAVIVAILTYYFGYSHGYTVGKKVSKESGEK